MVRKCASAPLSLLFPPDLGGTPPAASPDSGGAPPQPCAPSSAPRAPLLGDGVELARIKDALTLPSGADHPLRAVLPPGGGKKVGPSALTLGSIRRPPGSRDGPRLRPYASTAAAPDRRAVSTAPAALPHASAPLLPINAVRRGTARPIMPEVMLEVHAPASPPDSPTSMFGGSTSSMLSVSRPASRGQPPRPGAVPSIGLSRTAPPTPGGWGARHSAREDSSEPISRRLSQTKVPDLSSGESPVTATPSASSTAAGGASPAAPAAPVAPVPTTSPGDRGGHEVEETAHMRAELIRLRKRLHHTACELQETQKQLELANRELASARASHDEIRLKYSNLERSERVTSAELLEERRKCDELSKQVKAMSQNLLGIMGQHESSGADKDHSGLQKRCFKLVQQNTTLTVQSRLLRRQKGWAEAKAKVLQEEVTRVYLGTHDQVKSNSELERSYAREFSQREAAAANGAPSKDGAHICKLLLPHPYKHKEAVIDFLTHVTHTCGNDVHGFLQSSRVFTEAIRNDCIQGLGREYYAHWRQIRQVPLVLRAAERIVHLSQYLEAFEGFSKEISDLLGCAGAKLWVVDTFRDVLWTCFRNTGLTGEEAQTIELQIPKCREPSDLYGQSLVVSACVEQKLLNLQDASNDPRYSPSVDAQGGRPARSCLCVPFPTHGKPRMVLQATNKMLEPEFDLESDSRILRLLGKLALEVLQVCETNTTQSAFAKRKDSLLQLFNDFVPCQTAVQLLHATETGLRELFGAKMAALHTVQGRDLPLDRQSTSLLQVDLPPGPQAGRRKSIVNRIVSSGLRGIVGNAVRSLNNFSTSYAQKESSAHDPSVDLHIPEKMVLHTIPLIDSAGCCGVCQFVCPERQQSILADDFTFRADNVQHMRLLNILLKFVMKHLFIIDQSAVDSLQAQIALARSGGPHLFIETTDTPGRSESGLSSVYSTLDGAGGSTVGMKRQMTNQSKSDL